jgi:hypothetical protein
MSFDWLIGFIKYLGILIAGWGYGLLAVMVMIVIGACVLIATAAGRAVDEDWPS